MSTLAVVGFKDIHKAVEVRLQLWKLQRNYLLDLAVGASAGAVSGVLTDVGIDDNLRY